MGLTRKDVLKILGGTGAAAAAGRLGVGVGAPDLAEVDQKTVISRDVCVIGGGASGTYTAVRLRDLGKSVVVVEAKDRLGGHTETYRDPVTGGTTDIGVIVWHDLPLVRDYFARFDVPVTKFGSFGGETTYADFRTGRVVGGYTPPAPAALPTYLGLLQRYPYLEAGFHLPDPVPAELLAPFGDFVRANALESIVPLVFGFGQGLGDLLRQPTVYVVKNFGLGVVSNLLAGSFLTTSHRNNSELYTRAAAFLGPDVLLGSTVVATDRQAGRGVRVHVKTPSGWRLIRAKKLVITAPPLERNLTGFDLDRTERALFGQFRPNYYYTGAVRVPGLPDGMTVQNIGADTPYHLPTLPGLYSVYPTGVPGLHHVKYGSAAALTERQVKANISADIRRLAAAGAFPVRAPEFAVFRSHSPFELTVGASAIANGFYRHLYALQGRNDTFYTGAAFHTHDSSLLWQFTEALLPRIAA